ncbi:DUF4391 domain-containing protein [Bacillus cereus group sp. BY17LC]|uniref:DUF4391 domain-containing protein n=1 Tax=Bacillus cereus group TaxID=86661 RepID=UPI0022E3BFFF|nr:DUF4391 domain-containing protein [Bacillus cereus group sp. BY17LC]MDA1839638.1 DUF4391 domain-containing protein [Bacillus cereus group sp. BY17LC]
MSDMFYELIGLTDRLTPLNRKIDKKMFFNQMNFSTKEKQQITTWIDRVVMAYILAPQNINIHPYVDEEKKYENMSFIDISLKKELTLKQVQGLAEILHEALPNPTILCFGYNEQVLICTALKRINKNNIQKAVVEELLLSSWLNLEDMNDSTKQFIKKIHFSSVSFTTFYELYTDFHYGIQLLEVAEKNGEFIPYEKEELKTVQALIEQITGLEGEIEHYRRLMKKESQFNKKVEYNVKIQALRKQCETLKNKINL